MSDFALIASTMRDGIAVDEIEFAVGAGQSATGYLLGHGHDGPQPAVLALHDQRGDKATLLPDLEYLVARGFLCLSIDSPITRRASAARDPLAAFDSQFSIALAALNLLQPDLDVREGCTAILGRGIGGEVGAVIAAETDRIQVAVAIASLPNRSEFVRRSPHPLAAGLRQFHDDEAVTRQVEGLRPKRLVAQLEAATQTSWFLQVADDDDRFSDEDHATMSLAIPRTVRVNHVAHARDLSSVKSRRRRLDFISTLCG